MSRISNRQLVITFLACRLSAEMMTLSAETVLYGPGSLHGDTSCKDYCGTALYPSYPCDAEVQG